MPRRSAAASRPLDYERLHKRVTELHERVKTPDALAIHRKVLRDDNPFALALFARTAARYHAFPIAIKLFERAIACGSTNANDWNDLGLACLGAGDLDAARRRFEESAARDPSDFRAPVNVAVALQEQGDLDAARAQLERVAAAHPAEPAVALRRAELHLLRGEPDAALALLDAVRRAGAHPTWPLALEAVARAELGDEVGFRALMRYDDFALEIVAEPPEGFADVAEFDRRLRKHVSKHRTLVPDPDGYSTRGGRHTLGNLLRDTAPIVASMETVIQRAIERYVAALPAQRDHPFLARGDAFRLEAWAVVLASQGYHEAHVHRDGWVSGVYYVSVGDVVGEDPETAEGWLELGQGPTALHARGSSAPTKRVRPRDGLFVLFPSYCWHRTLPFQGRGERVAVAFDVIPTTSPRTAG